MIDSVFRTNKNCYPIGFLEECNYIEKDKNISKYVTNDMEISSNESDKEDFDEETSKRQKFNEESYIEK